MALFWRKRFLLTALNWMILLVLFWQLTIYFSRKVDDSPTREELGLEFLNKSSMEYQFINTYFSRASEGSWQYVTNKTQTKNKFLTFSAFLDDRLNDRFIRIIGAGMTKKKFVKEIWCKFWYRETNADPTIYQRKTIKGQTKLISEHWGLPYSAYYVICPMDVDLPIPDAVSLVTDPDQKPENLLKVIFNFEKPPKWSPYDLPTTLTKMAVCVKPLHYDYNKVMEILEFIELHQIMGVDHFFFYNHTVGAQVDCLLHNYIREGIVTILPWDLPLESQKEIRTEGIFAALNDCLYRTMHVYSHAIFIDFDEYLVPKNNYTYMEFFKYLNTHKNIEMKSTFIFQNAFFYKQWPDDTEVNNLNDPLAENLIVLQKTRRRTNLHPHRTRSKYIVRPELINMVGNHFIWEYLNKQYGEFKIGPEDGLLHHYRICEFGGDDCVNQQSIVDKTAYKYKDKLIRAVNSRFDKYKDQCQLQLVFEAS